MTEPRAPILIVDDLPGNLLALEAVIGDLASPLVQATSGQEALSALLRQDFAVILLDVRMPGMDGLETARYTRMASRSKSTPIIFLTAGDDDLDARLQAYSAGAVDYIRKPLQTDILRSKVRVFVELYAKENDLRKAYHDLEVFTYAVAHEFRAPLRAMSGFCQILRDEYADRPFDQQGQDYARRIEAGSRRLNALIRDLLAYCSVTRTPVETGPVDVALALRQSLHSLSSDLRAAGAEVDLPDEFPEILGHGPLLNVGFTALLSNAASFVPAEAKPRIRIGCDRRQGHVRIWIEDNGVGIPAEQQERIFGVFERLDPKTNAASTGMGLAIARAAVERMGGRVGVESEPGRGSRFWIELPAASTARRPTPAQLQGSRIPSA